MFNEALSLLAIALTLAATISVVMVVGLLRQFKQRCTLAATHAQFLSLFDQNPAPMLLVSLGDAPVVIDVNAEALRLLDGVHQSLKGVSVAALSRDLDVFLRGHQQKNEGESDSETTACTTTQVTFKRNTGDAFDAQVRCQQVLLDGQARRLILLTEISKEPWLSSQAQLLNDSNDFIAVIDQQKIVCYLNQPYQRLLGLKTYHGGLPLADLCPVEANKHLKSVVLPNVLSGKPWKGRIDLLGEDRQNIPVEASIFMLKASGEAEAHFALICRDLREINLAKLEISAKTEYVAHMSHELRTPLTAIIGFTEILLLEVDHPHHRELLELMQQAEKGLLSLIGDVLDFSKIEAGKLQLVPVPFLLTDLVARVENIFKLAAQRKGLELFFRIIPGTPNALIADEQRLGQVMINLVGNAMKFTKQGAITVEVASIRERDEQGNLRMFAISVKDTGIGISPEKKKKLFRPFAQADASIESQYGGSGLGLLISKNIATEMGGKIFAKSKEGVGSTFMFTFKAALDSNPSQALEETDVIPDHDVFAGKAILLVEDTDLSGMVVEKMLQTLGCQVRWVKSGEEAVSAVDDQRFDMVLMDVHMPGISGMEASRRIRNKSEHQSLPIVALTAAISAKDRNSCIENGMNDFLTKPVTLIELKRVLRLWKRSNN